jgi:hypothetical protein
MYMRNGAVLKTCKACYAAALSAGQAGGGKAVTSRPKDTQRTQVSAPGFPALSIEPGHGLTAHIHDGYLQMQQSDDEGTDTLMLSKSEAKALFREFADWAAS